MANALRRPRRSRRRRSAGATAARWTSCASAWACSCRMGRTSASVSSSSSSARLAHQMENCLLSCDYCLTAADYSCICVRRYAILDFTNIFFTTKNVLVILLMIYRLVVLQLKLRRAQNKLSLAALVPDLRASLSRMSRTSSSSHMRSGWLSDVCTSHILVVSLHKICCSAAANAGELIPFLGPSSLFLCSRAQSTEPHSRSTLSHSQSQSRVQSRNSPTEEPLQPPLLAGELLPRISNSVLNS